MPGQPNGVWAGVGRYGGHGLTIAAATAVFAWVGDLADERFHTEPLFVLLGAFLGFGGAFYMMYRDLVLRSDMHGSDGDDEPGRDADRSRGNGDGTA